MTLPSAGIPPLPPPPAGYAARVPRVAEATTLETVGRDAAGRDLRLTPPTARAWRAMSDAARADGVTLLPLSGFRSVAYQAGIVRRKLAAGQALADILRVSAYPGHSEHHAGTAIDVGSPDAKPLSEAFAATPAFAWLQGQAHRFGFHLSYPPDNPQGIAHEPWHWNHRPGSG